MRFLSYVIVFLLGMGAAYGAYYAGTPDYLAAHGWYDIFTGGGPPTAPPENGGGPPSSYPYPSQSYPSLSYPSQSYPSQSYPSQPYPSQSDPTQSYPPQAYPTQSYDAPPPGQSPSYTPPSYEPPSPAPYAPSGVPGSAPLSIRLSIGARAVESVQGCAPAYAVINATSRPIVLPSNRRAEPLVRSSEYGATRAEPLVVQPGQRQLAFAETASADPYADRAPAYDRPAPYDRGRLDYTRPYDDGDYAPRGCGEGEQAPAVNIEVSE